MPKEVELKLAFDPVDKDRLSAALVALPGVSPVLRSLKAAYYDTPDRQVQGAGFTVRLRQENGRQIQTIKASGSAAGLFVRPEWERPVDGDRPVPDPVAEPLHEAIGAAAVDRLEAVFQTDVMREKRVVEWEGARLEGAIDDGMLIAGNQQERMCELELELLSGDVKALFTLARVLDASAPLRLAVLSKSERGYRLADHGAVKAVKAEPVDLSSAVDARQAFERIGYACLRQIRLNEDMFLSTGSPESLHQMRVGVRRLRSAFTVFSPIVRGDPEWSRFTGGLKDLGKILGDVRDLDVLVAHLGVPKGECLKNPREEARDRAVMTLRMAKTRHLILDLAEWLALGLWHQHFENSRWNGCPPRDFAAYALRRCRKRLKKAGQGWAHLDADSRHRVRKEAKKLRYAVEFFASLFNDGEEREQRSMFRDALEELQDDLGALNDAVTGADLLAYFGVTDASVALPIHKRDGLIESAGQKLSAVLDKERFWRS